MSLPWRFATAQEYVMGTITRLKTHNPSFHHLNIGKYFLSTDELSQEQLLAILDAVMDNVHINELTFCGIHLGQNSLALARLTELLQIRKWRRTSFIACEGQTLTALAGDAEQSVKVESIRILRYLSVQVSDMVALKQCLMMNRHLEHLEISDADLTEGHNKQIMLPLACGIASSSSLKTLEFKYCTLNTEAVQNLSLHGLAKNTSLVSLHVPGCELEDESVRLVVEGISQHPNLRHLNFFRNHCGEGGVQALVKLLRTKENGVSDHLQLETLDLSYQQFERAKKLDIGTLANSLRQNTTLKRLILSFNKLNDEDAECLAEGIRAHSNLVEIDLRANNIRDKGTAALAEKVVAHSPQLRKFCLYGNPLGELGGRSLLAAIRTNTEIESINMDYNLSAYNMIQYYAYLNQVGRRLLKKDDCHPALWSVIIERANKVSLETRGVCTAADLIFPFIRESVILKGGR